MKNKLMAVLYVFWGIFISLCFLPVFIKSPPIIFVTLYIPIVAITFLLSVFVLAESYLSSPGTKRLYPATNDDADDMYDPDDNDDNDDYESKNKHPD